MYLNRISFGVNRSFSIGLSPPPLAVDPGRFYRPGEKYDRLFLLGKPHGACDLRRKSPSFGICVVNGVWNRWKGTCGQTMCICV